MFRFLCVHASIVLALCACCVFLPPSTRSGAGRQVPAVSRLDPGSFRCIIVGDSQTTLPYPARMMPQMQRWEVEHAGVQIGLNSSTGGLVHNGSAGLKQVVYDCIEPRTGWPNGGPNDYFAQCAANWTFLGDVDAPDARIGRYRVGFGSMNSNAPWSSDWGVGQNLVARIAIRTSPNSVGWIDTVPECGGELAESMRRTHQLARAWGVQIIEQPIPAWINPLALDMGVGLYLPDGVEEHKGEVLQVLGVVIDRVDTRGLRARGTLVGYQGNGGWCITDHLQHVSRTSRKALVELLDADTIVIALGHNREPGGTPSVEPGLRQLVREWESAYATLGRPRPRFVYLTLWPAEDEADQDYLRHVEGVMRTMASEHRADQLISMMEYFGYARPDAIDPERYRLDAFGLHPRDAATATHLAEDLYGMLFEGRRE